MTPFGLSGWEVLLGDAPVDAPGVTGGITGLPWGGAYGVDCMDRRGASSGSDLLSKDEAFGLGGVGPPWRGVRISSEGAPAS